MSLPEKQVPNYLRNEFDSRPGDALVIIHTEIPHIFIPLQTGGFRSPQYIIQEDVIYLPRGGTCLLVLGEDFKLALIKHLKRSPKHPDDRVYIFFDGKLKLDDKKEDFKMSGGKDLFFHSGRNNVQKAIDEDISFQVYFTAPQ